MVQFVYCVANGEDADGTSQANGVAPMAPPITP